MAMDADLLKTFLEVSRTRHFGKAADHLCVTQSTVSARIRQLEQEVGSALFIRSRNAIQLTAAGHRLVNHAENILTTWNRARQEIAIEDEHKVPLTVAGLPSLWDITLQDWLHHISADASDLMIQADVLDADVMMRRIQEGAVDIGFVFEVPQLVSLEACQIITIPLIMVSSTEDLDLDRALRDRYILVDWGVSFANAHARHFADMPTPALRMGLGRMARDYLLANGGSAYLAKSMVTEALERGELFLVKDAPIIERSASAVYLIKSDKRDIIRCLLEYYQV